MQSLEKLARLKPIADKTMAVTALTHDTPRPQVFVAALPIALMVLWGCATFAHRTVGEMLGTQTKLSRVEAQSVALRVFSNIIPAPVAPDRLEFSAQSVFSVRRNSAVAEWNVLYTNATNRQYSMRINAATKQVYAVNTVESVAVPLAVARPASESAISRRDAQQQAQRYLKAFGITDAALAESDAVMEMEPDFVTGNSDGTYAFTYAQSVPNVGRRIVKIAVNRETGELTHFWNPSGIR